MTDLKKFALIMAGGAGSRMGSDLPKQFLEIREKPILCWTIEAFQNYSESIEIILVLPSDWQQHWQSICANSNFNVEHKVITGGGTRTESVRNGLLAVPDGVLVAIHDGVRPLVSTKIIANSFAIAREQGAAIAAVPLKDSIRKIAGNASLAVKRDEFRAVQTPQTFKSDLIKNAYTSTDADEFTDDASVLELAGHKVGLFPGEYGNIKITTPEDLKVAEMLIRNRES